ncbi:MAG TPA: sigma-70 family RNA polymerase sigma factor [Thermoanaerobaculia bacterium]|nr:sigma-70 family RNA polymerase sigma factor [Thermoanaerobaculia bacterium]
MGSRREPRKPPPSPPGEVTRLLVAWSRGDAKALEDLIPLVYDELRRLAERHLSREAPGHTLQPTAVVHEAYLRLVDQKRVTWKNRGHFFAVAAQTMRRLLVDHARRRDAEKRGGTQTRVPLEEAVRSTPPRDADVIALDRALEKLAALDATQARVVELRYFGGLTLDETADVLGTSPSSIGRAFRLAKAWLYRELSVA